MEEMTDKEKLLFAKLKKDAARYCQWLKEINDEYYLQDHHKIVDDIARILGAIASPDEWDEESIKRWFS
jgi:cephalosporin-C deacetylase-like acetyl esterase